MEHTFYSTELGEWTTNINHEATDHCIRKDSIAFQPWTWVLKSRQFHKQIESLGCELSLKDYLLAVIFLVPLSSETGFVIRRPKGNSTIFIASYLEQFKIVL